MRTHRGAIWLWRTFGGFLYRQRFCQRYSPFQHRLMHRLSPTRRELDGSYDHHNIWGTSYCKYSQIKGATCNRGYMRKKFKENHRQNKKKTLAPRKSQPCGRTSAAVFAEKQKKMQFLRFSRQLKIVSCVDKRHIWFIQCIPPPPPFFFFFTPNKTGQSLYLIELWRQKCVPVQGKS